MMILHRLHTLTALLRDRKGLSMVEYALVGALIALAAATAVGNLGTAVTDTFTRFSAAITAVNTDIDQDPTET